MAIMRSGAFKKVPFLTLSFFFELTHWVSERMWEMSEIIVNPFSVMESLWSWPIDEQMKAGSSCFHFAVSIVVEAGRKTQEAP